MRPWHVSFEGPCDTQTKYIPLTDAHKSLVISLVDRAYRKKSWLDSGHAALQHLFTAQWPCPGRHRQHRLPIPRNTRLEARITPYRLPLDVYPQDDGLASPLALPARG